MANVSNKLDNLALPLSIVIASVIIGGSIVISSGRSTVSPTLAQEPKVQAPAPNQAPAQAVDIAKVKQNSPTIGRKDAPIVIAYWYDYKCSYCKIASDQILAPLVTEYVNTGKVRIIFKDMQFLGQDSQRLGLASRAVWEVNQAKWFEWHEAIFDTQQQTVGSSIDDKIKSISEKVLGQTQANRVMSLLSTKAAAYQAALDADRAEGNSFGVRSTPTFIMGKQMIVGARPYSDFTAALKNLAK